MKPAGFLCNIDNLGRIVIPAPLRKSYDLEKGCAVELFTDSEGITMRKYNPSCIFCGSATNVTTFRGKIVCEDCLREMNRTR